MHVLAVPGIAASKRGGPDPVGSADDAQRVWQAAHAELKTITLDTDTTVHTLFGHQMSGRNPVGRVCLVDQE